VGELYAHLAVLYSEGAYSLRARAMSVRSTVLKALLKSREVRVV